MKNLPLILFVAAMTALWSSCERNPDPPPPPQGDTTYSTRSLLAATVYTTGTQVGTTTYRYDAQKRLIWVANTSSVATDLQDTTEITRTAQGVISQIIYNAPKYNNRPDMVDNVVTQAVFYDAAASRYMYKTAQYTAKGAPFRDSIVYSYDAQGRINKETAYYYDFGGRKYVLYGTMDFVYGAAGDVTSRKTVFNNINGTTNNYEFTFTYTYDDKANGLNLGNEAVVMGLQEAWSGHNPLTVTSVYPPPDAAASETRTYTYKYNTANRPLSAEINSTRNYKTTIVYTYQ